MNLSDIEMIYGSVGGFALVYLLWFGGICIFAKENIASKRNLFRMFPNAYGLAAASLIAGVAGSRFIGWEKWAFFGASAGFLTYLILCVMRLFADYWWRGNRLPETSDTAKGGGNGGGDEGGKATGDKGKESEDDHFATLLRSVIKVVLKDASIPPELQHELQAALDKAIAAMKAQAANGGASERVVSFKTPG
jgi:hypothetical protein